MKPTVLIISSANMDLNMRVKNCPLKGQTVMGDSYSYVSGGKGANSATAVAKLGGNSIFCAALGDDENGKTLKNIYDKTGINTSYIKIKQDAPTGLATVTVESCGSNRIVVFSGANALLSDSDAIKAVSETKPDAVFCHFEIPYDTVVSVSEYCYKNNIPLVIDAGPADTGIDLSKLSPMTVFSPNETETEIFTGILPDNNESALAAAKKLKELVSAKYYVIKLGSRGVAVYDSEKLTEIPTYPVKVSDTTAAGDSFTAAMTLEYVKSGDIYRSCRYGNAVASVTVSRKGAADSIPNQSELESFIMERNIVI